MVERKRIWPIFEKFGFMEKTNDSLQQKQGKVNGEMGRVM